MEALKKMSAKSILGNVRRFVPLDDKRDIIDGEKIALFRVYGMARGTKSDTGDNGPWTAFLGDFRAERLDEKTGEVLQYGSGTLFLPSCAETLLIPAVEKSDGSGVEFAFDIGLVGRPTSSVGYEFTAETVLPVKESEAIASLAAKMTPPKWATKQLTAPTGESEGPKDPPAATSKGKKTEQAAA